MRIAIIDDILECRNEIQSCLRRFFSEHYSDEPLFTEEFLNGEDFISAFTTDKYDLIFIDQYMAGLSGIDTAKLIRQSDELAALVFITTSRDHAVESYQVKARGYLLKPFAYEDFEQTLMLLGMSSLRNARFITVHDEKILLREILWCDIIGQYIQIHTQQRGTLRNRLPFGTLAERLLCYPQFLTCYRGCIVNLDHVVLMNETEFLLTNGKKILFPRRDKKKIEDSYHTYLFQKMREEELL